MLTAEQRTALATIAREVLPTVSLPQTERWVFFVIRRGAFHLANSGLPVTDAEIKTRLTANVNAAKTFLVEELGTGTGALAGRTPAHLDLTDVCRGRTGMTATAAGPTIREATKERKELIAKIALRALAAHFDLWTGTTIDKPATREIIDRRLRIVERMQWSINGGAQATWTLAGPSSWTDGNRTRVAEYPFINGEGMRSLIAAATKQQVTIPARDGRRGAVYKQGGGQTWDWLRVKFNDGTLRELLWDEPPPWPEAQTNDDPDPATATQALTNARLPTAQLRRAFKVSPVDSHALRFMPAALQTVPAQAVTLSAAIDALFAAGKEDYWTRAWVYCDHIIAAAHLEALLFARRRRTTTVEADTEIDALVDVPPGSPVHSTYVWLGAIPVEAINRPNQQHGGLLDGRPGNLYFRTLLKKPDTAEPNHDLEIGDQVIFFNNGIYDLLTAGALRLENATITDLAALPDGRLDVAKIRFSGHGMTGSVASYAQDFVDTITTEVGEVRETIAKAVAADATATIVPLETGHRAIRWAPYPLSTAATAAARPWWLVYPLETPAGTSYAPIETTVAKAVLALPGTFGVRTGAAGPEVVTAVRPAGGGPPTLLPIATGTGFTAFDAIDPALLPLDKTVLFPLADPSAVARDDVDERLPGWGRYLRRRAQAATGTKLAPLTIDITHIPGLFDPDGAIWATGPRVRP